MNADSSYLALVNQAKAGGEVDFTKLRLLYAASPYYDPYERYSRQEMHRAFRTGNHPEAISYAQKTIAKRFVDFEAHVTCRKSYLELGDTAMANHHGKIARGLLASILGSGNGRSMDDSAFVVIMVPEEYAVLSYFGLRQVKQVLIEQNGHSYDEMIVEDINQGKIDTVYFNVDLPINWWEKKTGE